MPPQIALGVAYVLTFATNEMGDDLADGAPSDAHESGPVFLAMPEPTDEDLLGVLRAVANAFERAPSVGMPRARCELRNSEMRMGVGSSCVPAKTVPTPTPSSP